MADQKNTTPVKAGIVGTVIGAAVGAAAVYFAKEENRKQATKKIQDLKKQGNKLMNSATDKTSEVTEDMKKKMDKTMDSLHDKSEDVKTKAKDKMDEIKDSADKTLDKVNKK